MKWTTLLLIFITLAARAQDNSYLRVLHQGDLFETPMPRMVVLDDRTFGQYYFYRVHFDSLQKKVIAFDHAFKHLDSLNYRKIKTLQALIHEKDHQVATGHKAYLDMKAMADTSLEKADRLQKQYIRQSRQTKFWKTATVILSGVTLIVVGL